MKTAMDGTGFFGLVPGMFFRDFGHDVICPDKEPLKIDMLRSVKVAIL